MTDEIMDKLVVYSIVFEVFVILLLVTITVALAADTMKNIYELKIHKIDYF